MTSVAEAVCRTLKAYGTEYFFCLTGGDHALWIALDDAGIEVVLCRSEHAAVYAADGYARASGKPGYVYGQYGPGVANVVAGLADPYWASSPVISLTTSMRTTSLGRYEYQELDQLPMHSAVTAWSKTAIRPDQVLPFLRTAIRVATSTPPKPVHLEIPSDVMQAELDDDEPGAQVYAEPDFGRVPGLRVAPDAAAVRRALDALSTSSRPLILSGTGVMLSEAWDEMREFAEMVNVPVVTSLGGKGTIDETHPLAVGLIGRYSRKVANDLTGEADLLFVVGSRLGGMVTNGWRVPAPGTRIIHVDADATVMGTTYREEVGVVGDAKLSLRALIDAFRSAGTTPSYNDWTAHVTARVGQWRLRAKAVAESRPPGPGAIHPAAVIAALRQQLEPTDVLVTDTGYMGAWAGALYPVTAPGRHFLRAAGSLGWALPASMGAALASPGRRVACVIGDGGVGYHLMELETALRCGIDVTVVVLNNRSLAFEYHGQKLQWNNRVLPKVNDFLDVDYAAVARSLGAEGIRVDHVVDLTAALHEALTCGRPALLDVRVDKEVWAPVTNFETIVPRDV
jgi:acetolactate synthase I/II/III large subunit